MRLLRQENVALEHQGAQFNLIGVDYQRDHMTRGPRGPMLQNIEHLVSRDMPNILLSHNPNSFHRAADLGVELSLAGHTHGGQVKVEIVDHSIPSAPDYRFCRRALSPADGKRQFNEWKREKGVFVRKPRPGNLWQAGPDWGSARDHIAHTASGLSDTFTLAYWNCLGRHHGAEMAGFFAFLSG